MLEFFKHINHGVAALTTIGMLFTAFLFMDARHMERRAEYELKAEIIDLDIKKDAEVINYYRNREMTSETLNAAEQNRYKYLQKEMDRKVRKKDLLEQRVMELSSPKG